MANNRRTWCRQEMKLTLLLNWWLVAQIVSQPLDRCVINDFSVRIGAISIDSSRSTDTSALVEVLVAFRHVVPVEVSQRIDIITTCQTQASSGVITRLNGQEQDPESRLFLCLIGIDDIPNCAPDNLVVHAIATVGDNERSLGCQRTATATTSICRNTQEVVNRTELTESGETELFCGIHGLQVDVVRVLRDPKNVLKMRVDIEGYISGVNAEDHQLAFDQFCTLNGYQGEASPVELSLQRFRFSCEVWAMYPFDCMGNILEIRVKALVIGNSECGSQSSGQYGICLDSRTGDGVHRLDIQSVAQTPKTFFPPRECSVALPSIQLLQIVPDAVDSFLVIVDAVVEFPSLHQPNLQVTHSCSSNGHPGSVSTFEGHEGIVSCTARVGWPFNCGSNFIDVGSRVTDTAQVPPCSIYVGKRFSYCLENLRAPPLVLNLQDMVFPVAPALGIGELGTDPSFLTSSFSTPNPQSIQCPKGDIQLEIIQITKGDKHDNLFILDVAAGTPSNANVQPQCFANGSPGQAILGQTFRDGVLFRCEAVSLYPFACGRNLITIFVDSVTQNAYTKCNQNGGLQVSVCLIGNNSVRILEYLDVSGPPSLQSRVQSGQAGLSFFPVNHHGGDARESVHEYDQYHTSLWKPKEPIDRRGWYQKTHQTPVITHGYSVSDWKHDDAWDYGAESSHGQGSAMWKAARSGWNDGWLHQDGFMPQKVFHSDQYGPQLPVCATVGTGLDIQPQNIVTDPNDINRVIVEATIIVGGDGNVQQGHPTYGCSIDDRDGSITDLEPINIGFAFVCTLESARPLNCEGNLVRLFVQGSIKASGSPCELSLLFRYCVDPQTRQVQVHRVDNEEQKNHEWPKNPDHYIGAYKPGYGRQQPCTVRGDLAVDLLGIVWDEFSQKVSLQLLLRYQHGPPPEVLVQADALKIEPACVLHGRFGVASFPVPEAQGLAFTCSMVVDWPKLCGGNWVDVLVEVRENHPSFHLESDRKAHLHPSSDSHKSKGPTGCNKSASRKVSFCIDVDTSRAILLASLINDREHHRYNRVCDVRGMESTTLMVHEIHHPGFVPLLVATISVNYTLEPQHLDSYQETPSLDPLRDIKYACRGNGVRGRVGALKSTPSGWRFTCSIPFHNRFDCLTTEIQSLTYLSHSRAVAAGGLACSETYSSVYSHHCKQPECRLFALDMGYHSRAGLLTDSNIARVILSCTHAVEVCKDCFVVLGPRFPVVEHLQSGNDGLHTYYLYLNWEESYIGPVAISVEASRRRSECSMNLLGVDSILVVNPGCTRENITSVGPVRDLQFSVRNFGDVLVKTFGYETTKGCTDHCSMSL